MRFRLESIGALFVLALGCSSSSKTNAPATPTTGDDASAAELDAGTVDASEAIDAAATYPAPHSAMPTIGTHNGPVLTAPKIVAIVFSGDPMASQISDFVTKFGAATSYWSGTTSEYGVGPIASATTITLDETPDATIDDQAIRSWLAAKIASDADAGTSLPAYDANTIYTVFYPANVTVTSPSGTSCDAFEGYHADFPTLDGHRGTYAVLPRCPPQVSGLSPIDALAATTSHEFIEAATDPLAITNPAWSFVDDDHIAWAILGGGGEIGDVCAAFPGVFSDTSDLSFLVQHVWSNKASAAGHDPCEPDGAKPYFNSAPVLNDTIKIDDPTFGPVTTKGVEIAVGASKTIELDLYSDAPTSGEWTVTPVDLASEFYGEPAQLSFKLDTSKGKNGDKLNLTIHVISKGASGAEMFWLQSQLGSVQTVWVGYVGS